MAQLSFCNKYLNILAIVSHIPSDGKIVGWKASLDFLKSLDLLDEIFNEPILMKCTLSDFHLDNGLLWAPREMFITSVGIHFN